MKTSVRILIIPVLIFTFCGLSTSPCNAQGAAKVISKGWSFFTRAGKSAGKVIGNGTKRIAPLTDDMIRAAQRSRGKSTTTATSCIACRGTAYPYQLQKCSYCNYGRTSGGYGCMVCGGSGFVYACPKCRKVHHHK